MAHRLLAALLVLVLGVLPAAAQSESSSLRTREAAAALVRGSVEQAITLYTEALEDKSLPNDRRATILNDRGVAYSAPPADQGSDRGLQPGDPALSRVCRHLQQSR